MPVEGSGLGRMHIASHTLEGEIADQHERLASALETLPVLFRNVHWPAGSSAILLPGWRP